MNKKEIPARVLQTFREGTVIPSLPIALTEGRILDETRQRAVIRYYIDAGAGGIAVGVNGAESRKAEIALLESLTAMASETIDRWCERKGRQILKVITVSGKTKQALSEAENAYRLGYNACLLNLAALSAASESDIFEHCAAVADAMPIIGHYPSSAAGGRPLSVQFWRRFAEIENLIGIRIAPSNRYQTLDVVRAVCEAGKEKDIALYTGNEDNILIDLLTSYKIATVAGIKQVRIVGGILAQWGVWTSKAVELLKHVHAIYRENRPLPVELLSVAVELTDVGSAVLDAANDFAGRTIGINEVLRRQGLLRGNWGANPSDDLSPGQGEEIDRVYRTYPQHIDDDLVTESLSRWLAD